MLHELAHCKSNFNRAKSGSIISLFDENSLEEYELKADKQAFNWMISDDEYRIILESGNYYYEIMFFLVYRLAFDNKIKYNSKIYQDNNKIIN